MPKRTEARILSGMKQRVGVLLILLFAFLGLADSVYLAQHAATDTPLLCGIENLSGCNIVAQSPYSKFLGIPLSEYGVLFYTIVFVLAALELVVFDQLLRRVLQGLAIIGVFFSIGLTALQLFVIKALCMYCLASALFAFLILIAATLIEPVRKTVIERQQTPPPAPPPPPPPFSFPPLS